MIVVYPPTVPWGKFLQRPHHIMRQFARDGWTAIYCDTRPHVLEEVEESLFVTSNYSDALQHLGAKKADLLYATWPRRYEWADKADAVLYDRVDSFSEWDKWEADMMDVADFVITTSKTLVNDGEHYVPNACAENRIVRPGDALPLPPEAPHLPGRVVGFSGAIGPWVDKEIIEDVSLSYSTLIMGSDEHIGEAYSLGHIPYEYIHLYYNLMDIGLVPFDNSRTAMNACPIKAYEYLAAGLEVVSTDIPEMRELGDLVHISDNFVSTICNLTYGKQWEKYKFSQANTWKIRYEQIKEILNG